MAHAEIVRAFHICFNHVARARLNLRNDDSIFLALEIKVRKKSAVITLRREIVATKRKRVSERKERVGIQLAFLRSLEEISKRGSVVVVGLVDVALAISD